MGNWIFHFSKLAGKGANEHSLQHLEREPGRWAGQAGRRRARHPAALALGRPAKQSQVLSLPCPLVAVSLREEMELTLVSDLQMSRVRA